MTGGPIDAKVKKSKINLPHSDLPILMPK